MTHRKIKKLIIIAGIAIGVNLGIGTYNGGWTMKSEEEEIIKKTFYNQVSNLLMTKYKESDVDKLILTVQSQSMNNFVMPLNECYDFFANEPIQKSMCIFSPKFNQDKKMHANLIKGAALYPPELEISSHLYAVHIGNEDVAKQLMHSAMYEHPLAITLIGELVKLYDLDSIQPQHPMLITVNILKSNLDCSLYKQYWLPIPTNCHESYSLRFNPIYARSDNETIILFDKLHTIYTEKTNQLDEL